MSRKSLLTTIRPSFFNLNLSNLNTKFYLLGLNFLKSFEQLMLKKGIIFTRPYLNQSGNTLIFKASLFITTSHLKKLKIKSKNVQLKTSISQEGILGVLKNLMVQQRIAHAITHFKILNKSLEKKHLFFLFKNFKKYMFKIFVRRFNLFIDFIKITSLFTKNLIELSAYILIISQIFKHLRKRAHITFYSFLKKTLNILVFGSDEFTTSQNRIKGVRIVIKGRLLGKARASRYKIQIGSVPVQTLDAFISYAQATSFTHNCGAFGFEIWLNR